MSHLDEKETETPEPETEDALEFKLEIKYPFLILGIISLIDITKCMWFNTYPWLTTFMIATILLLKNIEYLNRFDE